MFFKCLSCIILFSEQIFPLLGYVIPPVTANNNSFINDPDSLSIFAKYEEWNPRVINGWEAKLGDVPYQAALKMMISRAKGLFMTFCGAVIIAPKKLLSAAHCFEEKERISDCEKILCPGRVSKTKIKHIHVVGGTLKNIARHGSDGQWRRLLKVRLPGSYKFPKDDIAVLIIKEKFEFNYEIGPIPLASVDGNYEGKCLASGYGRTGTSEDSVPSQYLLMVHLTIIPKEVCNMLKKNSEHFICTSVKFTNLGSGDSGGPLVCSGTGDPNEGSSGVLVGITSATIKAYADWGGMAKGNSETRHSSALH
ncbi:hypothetical protein PYW08_003326 [Mythimna loreyi]|uniref:Uncharacterized protein n=1 Tax=Mythimna loreyi TaxID=667449 RepID=A0ACC2QTG2_9NEOP|nr:hypothetical protein PYW08_003326 [Mythimna loreyi]